MADCDYDESLDGVPLSESDDNTGNGNGRPQAVSKSAESKRSADNSDSNSKLSGTKAVGFRMSKSSSSGPKGDIHSKTGTSAAYGQKSVSSTAASTKSSKITAIKMTIGGQPKEPQSNVLKRPNKLISEVFNPDESDEEEMPPEAKMRMRNMGKDTPTAEGPNSFSKGRLGFCNRQKILQRELEEKAAGDRGNKK